MNMLIDPSNPSYKLGFNVMDETHQEFIELVNKISVSETQAEFTNLFEQLMFHTELHFEQENELMEETEFPAIREHMDEHLRVLGEMHRFFQKVKKGSLIMAKIYVIEHLPVWFNIHAATMDSALAAHVKLMREMTV